MMPDGLKMRMMLGLMVILIQISRSEMKNCWMIPFDYDDCFGRMKSCDEHHDDYYGLSYDYSGINDAGDDEDYGDDP